MITHQPKRRGIAAPRIQVSCARIGGHLAYASTADARYGSTETIGTLNFARVPTP